MKKYHTCAISLGKADYNFTEFDGKVDKSTAVGRHKWAEIRGNLLTMWKGMWSAGGVARIVVTGEDGGKLCEIIGRKLGCRVHCRTVEKEVAVLRLATAHFNSFVSS